MNENNGPGGEESCASGFVNERMRKRLNWDEKHASKRYDATIPIAPGGNE